MTGRDQRARFQQLLAEELVRLMVADGWSVDPAQDCSPDSTTIAAFRRPVAQDFAATVRFERPYAIPDRPPLCVHARVGVSFEPLYRLWPLLRDDMPAGELETSGRTPQDCADIENAGHVPHTARELVALVTEHAIPFARQHANVETLLEKYRGDPDRFHREIQLVPALLAAAGRLDEARAALTDYRASGRDETREQEFRRFARLLTHWLDAGGVIPDPPTAPPVHEPRPELPRLRDAIRDAVREDRARHDAYAAVLKTAQDKSRDQLRALLNQELTARHASMEPLTLEYAIDLLLLRQQPFGRLQTTAHTLGQVGKLGASVITMIRNHNFTDPEWLRPPDRAGYEIPTNRPTTAVTLDHDATHWLDRAHAAAARRYGDTVRLDAWLDWDTTQPDRIAVHIGNHRVGILTADATKRYRPAMQRAATRDEVPYLRAELAATHREPRYLMQIDTPTSDPGNV